MAKYIIEIPDEVPVSNELVPFDMCRPSWYWEAYKKGKAEAEDEVWNFAKAVSIMKPEDKRECWGTDKYNTINLGYSYQEAKSKYEAWKKQKDEIHVGDEVEQITASGNPVGLKCVVTKIVDNEILKGIIQTGEVVTCSSQIKKWWRKTGRHFDEVERLLERMREQE